MLFLNIKDECGICQKHFSDIICQGLSNSFRKYVVPSQCAMLQVNDHPSGGRSHLCNADRHAKYKKNKIQKSKIQKDTKYKKWKVQHLYSRDGRKYKKLAKIRNQKDNKFHFSSLFLESLLLKPSLEKYIHTYFVLVKYEYSCISDTFVRALSSKSSKLVFRFSSSLLPTSFTYEKAPKLVGERHSARRYVSLFFQEKYVKWKIKALFRILWKKLKHGKSPLCPFHSGTGLKSWQFQVLFYNFFPYHLLKLKILCLLIFRYNTPKYLTDQVQGLR